VVGDIGQARASIATEQGITTAEAKLLINRTLHGGKVNCTGPVLEGLKAEMETLAAAIRSDSAFEAMVGIARNDGSLVSLIWQTFEHECLTAALAVVGNDPRIVRVFDGMLLPNELVSDATISKMQSAMQCIIPGMELVVKSW
jgi:hypothetical protein